MAPTTSTTRPPGVPRRTAVMGRPWTDRPISTTSIASTGGATVVMTGPEVVVGPPALGVVGAEADVGAVVVVAAVAVVAVVDAAVVVAVVVVVVAAGLVVTGTKP
jgi:hypothetical protein